MLKTTDLLGSFSRRIYSLLAVMGFLSVSALLGVSLWMSASLNKTYVEGRSDLLSKSMQSNADAVDWLLHTYTDWDAAFYAVAEKDAAEFKELFSEFHTSDTEPDLLLVYDADHAPWLALWHDNRSTDLSAFETYDFSALVKRYRDQPSTATNTLWGHIHINDQVAAVSIRRINPEEMDPAKKPPESLGVAVALDFYGEDDLAVFSTETELENLSFQTEPDLERHGNTALKDIDGETVGYIGWDVVEYPGHALLRQSALLLLVVGTALVAGSFLIARSVSHQTRALMVERIRAREDALTGLANRTGWNEMITSDAIADEIRNGRVACLYLDIDRFKSLNDTHGHDIGDVALIKLAQNLRAASDPQDYLARLGGDEFVALVVGPDAESRAHKIADQLRAQLTSPVKLSQTVRHQIEVSLGIVVSQEGSNWRHMIAQADSAMYAEKRERAEARSTLAAEDPNIVHLRANSI